MQRETEQWAAYIKNELVRKEIKRKIYGSTIEAASKLLYKINILISDLPEPKIGSTSCYLSITYYDEKYDTKSKGKKPKPLCQFLVIGKSIRAIRNNITEAILRNVDGAENLKVNKEDFTESVLNINDFDVYKNKAVSLLYLYYKGKELPGIKVYTYEEPKIKSAERSFLAMTSFEMPTEGIIKKIKRSLPNIDVPSPEITDKPNKRVLKWHIGKDTLRIQIKLKGIVVSLQMDNKNYKGSAPSVVGLFSKPIWSDTLSFFEVDDLKVKGMKLITRTYGSPEEKEPEAPEFVTSFLSELREYKVAEPSKIRPAFGNQRGWCLVWKWARDDCSVIRLTDKMEVSLYEHQPKPQISTAGKFFLNHKDFFNRDEFLNWAVEYENRTPLKIRKLKHKRKEVVEHKEEVTDNSANIFQAIEEVKKEVEKEPVLGYNDGYFDSTLEIVRELYEDSSISKKSFMEILKSKQEKLNKLGCKKSLIENL